MSTKVIVAPQEIVKNNDVTVFLAGGITDCPWWQDEVIEYLCTHEAPCTILNPRRS